jgi:hypothetical protein
MRRPVKGQYRLPVPVYLSRRRADVSDTNNTPEEEIETESTGLLFITEASSNANPDYIITE